MPLVALELLVVARVLLDAPPWTFAWSTARRSSETTNGFLMLLMSMIRAGADGRARAELVDLHEVLLAVLRERHRALGVLTRLPGEPADDRHLRVQHPLLHLADVEDREARKPLPSAACAM